MTKKLYTICPEYKKSLTEFRTFHNEETGTTVTMEELWRSGSYIIALTDEEHSELSESEFVDLDDYPNQMEDTWDCCYAGWEVRNSKWTDEECEELQAELEEIAEEDYVDDEWFENNGYVFGDSWAEITCKPLLEEYTDEEGWYSELLVEDEDEEEVEV